MPRLQITQQGRGTSSVPAVAPGQAGRHGHPRGHHVVARANALTPSADCFHCMGMQNIHGSHGCVTRLLWPTHPGVCMHRGALGGAWRARPRPPSSRAHHLVASLLSMHFLAPPQREQRQTPPLGASPWLLLCSSWSELRDGWEPWDPEMLGSPAPGVGHTAKTTPFAHGGFVSTEKSSYGIASNTNDLHGEGNHEQCLKTQHQLLPRTCGSGSMLIR